MNKLMQEAPQRERLLNRDHLKPKQRQILVLKTGIAGLQFNIESDEEEAALNAVTPGTELKLYREPDNHYDEWAIAVYLTEDDKIGYITRFKNEAIARLMDVGKKFIAIVDDPVVDEEAKRIVEEDRKRNQQAPTENMAMPVSIYLVEEG
ncbi:MAG: HIRAN domain-containing protein [Ruminococcus sp.]|nr:HIRAN domain-containing protein [Ruminococcus sp.]